MQPHSLEGSFRHEALLYAGRAEFVAGISSFIREGVRTGEPTLVVVDAEKIDLLRSSLDGEGDGVHFADMAEVGRNPARIIPAWREFVDEHAVGGRRLRGIGEPIWPGRSPAELVECQLHESLLNVAFGGSPAWWLLCPYDTSALDPAVIAEARRTHPFVLEGSTQRESASYRDLGTDAAPLDGSLREPPAGQASVLPFGAGPLSPVRTFVSDHASGAGLDAARTVDLVLAVSELATNSLRYGSGQGTLRIWQDPAALICEVRDAGRITQALVGREHPSTDGIGGRGLWMVNQLCDLVQVRSSGDGTVIRLHMWRG